ncbi:MAG: hypothetical protein NW215_15665 [Hyphomicrobiales bacterium]|nr:hypothetical protein [Hyphomicrobiales bacterium]
MKRFLKFAHTLGAVGLMGAAACLLVLLRFLPDPSALAEYAQMRAGMAAVSKWVFMPSLTLTLLAGLLSMAATKGFQDAGWVLIKLATGVLVFEMGLVGVDGPMGKEAALAAEALKGNAGAGKLGASLGSEATTLWLLMGVSVANVALGVWRPRLLRRQRG